MFDGGFGERQPFACKRGIILRIGAGGAQIIAIRLLKLPQHFSLRGIETLNHRVDGGGLIVEVPLVGDFKQIS